MVQIFLFYLSLKFIEKAQWRNTKLGYMCFQQEVREMLDNSQGVRMVPAHGVDPCPGDWATREKGEFE